MFWVSADLLWCKGLHLAVVAMFPPGQLGGSQRLPFTCPRTELHDNKEQVQRKQASRSLQPLKAWPPPSSVLHAETGPSCCTTRGQEQPVALLQPGSEPNWRHLERSWTQGSQTLGSGSSAKLKHKARDALVLGTPGTWHGEATSRGSPFLLVDGVLAMVVEVAAFTRGCAFWTMKPSVGWGLLSKCHPFSLPPCLPPLQDTIHGLSVGAWPLALGEQSPSERQPVPHGARRN